MPEAWQLQLPLGLVASQTDFPVRLTGCLKALPEGSLPLDTATTQGGWVDYQSLEVTVVSITSAPGSLVTEIRLIVWFEELVGGCNCGDDPFRAPGQRGLLLQLHSATGECRVELWDDH